MMSKKYSLVSIAVVILFGAAIGGVFVFGKNVKTKETQSQQQIQVHPLDF